MMLWLVYVLLPVTHPSQEPDSDGECGSGLWSLFFRKKETCVHKALQGHSLRLSLMLRNLLCLVCIYQVILIQSCENLIWQLNICAEVGFI